MIAPTRAHSAYHHDLHGLRDIVCLLHTFDDGVFKIFALHVLHLSRVKRDLQDIDCNSVVFSKCKVL